MTETISNAVAKVDQHDKVVNWVESAGADYGRVLPAHLPVEHWVRLATGLLRRDQRLAEVAIRNPQSLKHALLECARLGHEPGTDAFALVAFGNEITGIEMFQGVIDRMFRAGGVASVVCEVVRANDEFHWNPGEPPLHNANWFDSVKQRGDVIGVYAYATLTGGGISNVVVMSSEEVAKHRAIAKQDHIWKAWPDAMYRKTAIHSLRKWVPTSAEYRREQLRATAAAQPVYKIDGEVLDSDQA